MYLQHFLKTIDVFKNYALACLIHVIMTMQNQGSGF